MKTFYGRWKRDKKSGLLVWKWKRRKTKSLSPTIRNEHEGDIHD